MNRFFFTAGAILAAIGVMAGAFGAHALEDILSDDMLDIWDTAVLYHLIHSVAFFAVARAIVRWGGTSPLVAGWCFLAGILIFSGSLYTLSLTGIKKLGAITPIGGVALIAGWLALAWAGLSSG